ncbi:hypothetical protein GCM10010967_29590 [Dyadobacter beijingensis]|uniref:Uncharacterized protein n=1 Tax=Dyadobacter beijingensis TaxID=365489 RepID=A0ABQ2HYE3_9BACT|nr:hypothetical protein GCM10010967_29590 [Dyadobacter beijingensis]
MINGKLIPQPLYDPQESQALADQRKEHHSHGNEDDFVAEREGRAVGGVGG